MESRTPASRACPGHTEDSVFPSLPPSAPGWGPLSLSRPLFFHVQDEGLKFQSFRDSEGHGWAWGRGGVVTCPLKLYANCRFSARFSGERFKRLTNLLGSPQKFRDRWSRKFPGPSDTNVLAFPSRPLPQLRLLPLLGLCVCLLIW